MTFLIILAFAAAYCFVGGLSGSAYQSIAGAKCTNGKRGHHDYTRNSGTRYWCGHTTLSVWAAGVFWPIGLPLLAGAGIGSINTTDRRDNKKARELEDARHQVELAKLRKQEDDILNDQLKQFAER